MSTPSSYSPAEPKFFKQILPFLVGFVVIAAVAVFALVAVLNQRNKPQTITVSEGTLTHIEQEIFKYYGTQLALSGIRVFTDPQGVATDGKSIDWGSLGSGSQSSLTEISLPFDPSELTSANAGAHTEPLLQALSQNVSLTQDGKEFAQTDLASSLASVGKYHEEFVAPEMDAESLESNRKTPGLQEVEPGVFRGAAVVGSLFTDTYSWPDSDLILIVCNVGISAISGPETTPFMDRPQVVALFDPKSQSFSAIRLATPGEYLRGFNVSKTLPFPADTGI